MAKRYEVLFDFEAEDPESELSVRKGEIVIESEEGETDGGWICIQVEKSERRNGFVPMSFLLPLSEEKKTPPPSSSSSTIEEEQPLPRRTPPNMEPSRPPILAQQLEALRLLSNSSSCNQQNHLASSSNGAFFADCSMAALVKAEKYDELLERFEHCLDHHLEKHQTKKDDLIQKATSLLAGLDELHQDLQQYCRNLEQDEDTFQSSSWLVPSDLGYNQ